MGTLTHSLAQTVTDPCSAPVCEHNQHTTRLDMHDEGPATHYVMKMHDCPIQKNLSKGQVFPVCKSFAMFVISRSLHQDTIKCLCQQHIPAHEFLSVVGEV